MHALPAEVVDDVEGAEDAAVSERVRDEVHSPALIRLAWCVEVLPPGRGDALRMRRRTSSPSSR